MTDDRPTSWRDRLGDVAAKATSAAQGAVADQREQRKQARAAEAERAAAHGSVFTVREEGRNGTVQLQGTRIVRTFRRTIGRDDTQTILVNRISHLELDRRRMGADIVHVHVGPHHYVWKTVQAEALHDSILSAMENPS